MCRVGWGGVTSSGPKAFDQKAKIGALLRLLRLKDFSYTWKAFSDEERPRKRRATAGEKEPKGEYLAAWYVILWRILSELCSFESAILSKPLNQWGSSNNECSVQVHPWGPAQEAPLGGDQTTDLCATLLRDTLRLMPARALSVVTSQRD